MIKTSNPTMSNIVKKTELREAQQFALTKLKEALLPSAGPFGSTTQIIKADPNNRNVQMVTEYTKDGHTILKNIKFNKAIEDSIQRELTDVTRYIKKTVGDGSTSTVVMSSLIFDSLLKLDEGKYPPYLIIETFKSIVKEMQDIIKKNGRELTIDDVYKICMICTNNNHEASTIISDIYKEHGLDVFIDVGVSTDENDVIKTYDGLTIETGYSTTAYINTLPKKTDEITSLMDSKEEKAGYSIIRKAKIYAFTDPIDTIEMHQLFNTIVLNNIMKPYMEYQKSGNSEALRKVVPTVIISPKISVDLNTSFKSIEEFMYGFNQNMDAKPPLLVITNVSGVDFEAYSDIWNLCGCKPIKKYIDPAIQKKEIEEGNAPTVDTVLSFCGYADEVKADAYKTTFINPRNMFKTYTEDGENYKVGDFVLDEEGNRVYSEVYNTQIAFLEQQLKLAISQGQDLNVTGNLKRRIHSLKANMVDYYVGGVTATDRDSTRKLVEDAVKNVRSAAVDGVGFGTNYEGLRAAYIMRCNANHTGLESAIIDAIYDAYLQMSKLLYGTVYYDNIMDSDNKEEYILAKNNYIDFLIEDSLAEDNGPMNFKTKEFDESVLCTISQDVVILEVLAKIITIIYTTNQSLTQSVAHNMYMDTSEF